MHSTTHIIEDEQRGKLGRINELMREIFGIGEQNDELWPWGSKMEEPYFNWAYRPEPWVGIKDKSTAKKLMDIAYTIYKCVYKGNEGLFSV
jgi:hypothetical protein